MLNTHMGCEQGLRSPQLECRGGILILVFSNPWQFQRMLQQSFAKEFTEKLRDSPRPLRMIVDLAHLQGITETDLGTLLAYLLPLIEDDAVIALARVHLDLAYRLRLMLLDMLFFIAEDLSEAADMVLSVD